jgi:hypothetical protein
LVIEIKRLIAFLVKRDALWKVVYITFAVIAIVFALVIPAVTRWYVR